MSCKHPIQRFTDLCSRWPLLAVAVLIAGCAQAQERSVAYPAVDDAAPLPLGWRDPGRVTQGHLQRDHSVGRVPLWGVPTVQEPSATHCARAPTFHEEPGLAYHPRTRASDRGSVAAAAPSVTIERRAEAGSLGAAESHAYAAPSAPSTSATAKVAASSAPHWVDEEPPSRHTKLPPSPPAVQGPIQNEAPVTAGMVDDNADFAAYLDFRSKHPHPLLRNRDIAERYRVVVRDREGRPVPDAELALTWRGAAEAVRWARTDGAGHAWLQPKALLSPQQSRNVERMQVLARQGDGPVVRAVLARGQTSPVVLTLDDPESNPRTGRTPLDLVFLVDATGSMGDEIDKLRTSMQTMADRIGALQGGVELCFGLVAFRDRGDEYLTRSWSLTQDLSAFQRVLGGLRANGGGDEPEALNEALDRAVHRMDWRGAGTSRLVVLVGDAPPQMNRGAPYYDQTSAAALARGIKVHAVGASGLNRQGEATFRSIAQATGGRFVFLTYKDARRPGRGPGSETVHDVRDYSVSTLDDLIVRLVREEVEARRGS